MSGRRQRHHPRPAAAVPPGVARAVPAHPTEAPDVHLPAPTVWPAAMGGGLALAAFGVPTNLAFTLVGLLLFAWALAGWIGVLRHEPSAHADAEPVAASRR